MPDVTETDASWFLALQARGIMAAMRVLPELPTGVAVAIDAWEEEFAAWWRSDADPEPVFVIRAQDRIGTAAISAYAKECRMQKLGDQADETVRALAEICSWQERHLDRLKMPDHVHVSRRRT